MNQIIEIVLVYLFGGLTLIPLSISLFLYFSTPASSQPTDSSKIKYNQPGKKGWIRLTKQYKSKGTSESNVAVLMSGIQSYVQGKRYREHVYAELKCGALFIYEAEDQEQQECKLIIPVHNYLVSIYPEHVQEHEIFSRSAALKLTPKDANTKEILLPGEISTTPSTSSNELYFTCARPVDKEDWYFGLLAASEMMTESPDHVEMMDETHFDPEAMQNLISTVQQDADYREVQWLNAIIGRLFLGIYKTQDMRQFFQEKIAKKTQKIKRPSFLADINVQSVDIGNASPFVTQPKLLSLTHEGDLMAEATIHYTGGLRVVIQTDFTWTYSTLMKPIIIPLVIGVTLKQLSGKFLLKVKPPPTNRYWIGFYEMPTMDWEITPIVSDKQIRLSMVTSAIQSKIREFMMENIVLPNMDDFPFCPSGGKGGVFGERVPKPSSPKESNIASTLTMNLDMLGNKLNQTKAPPKVVITPEPSSSLDTLQSLPKPPTRRAESLSVLLDSPRPSADQLMRNRRSKSICPVDESSQLATLLRSRGYSNPDIPLKIHQDDNQTVEEKELQIQELVVVEEKEEQVEAIVAADTPPSFTRRLSSNIIGLRKRSTTQPLLEEDVLSIEEPESVFPLDTTYNKVEVITQETITPPPPRSDDTRSIKSATKVTLISKLNKINTSAIKINAASAAMKITNNKKLYNMAGNIFNKKNTKVTKEMREERNRELQESHNRKMMNLFLNEPSQPPPLPPRRKVSNSLSSLSSTDDDEDETIHQETLLHNDILKHNGSQVMIVDETHHSSFTGL